MFTNTIQYQNVQRAICLFFSALIVSSALTLGYVGAEVAEQNAIAALSEARVGDEHGSVRQRNRERARM